MINDASDLARRFWDHGRVDDCPILDFHGHMGSFRGAYMPRCSPEAMLETMDACNTRLTCFCGHEALTSPTIGVERDLAAAARYPDRFKVYHSVVSGYLDPEADLRRMDTHRDLLVGFKFHAGFHKVALDDPLHRPYWDYADAHGLLVLCHTWGRSRLDGLDQARSILGRCRNLAFIAGHSFHGDWDEAVDLALEFPNLYLELTAVLDDRGVLDRFVERGGSKRILFGTDLPWFSTHHGIGAVLAADIDDDQRRDIFYRNGAELLERFPWFRM